MKKLNKTLCAVALTVSVLPIAALTACDPAAKDPVGLDSVSGIINQSMTSDSQSATDSGSGTTDTSAEDRFTVTENEWRSAFDRESFGNCTVTYAATGENDVLNVTLRSDLAGGKIYLAMTDVYNGQTASYEAVAAKLGDKYYGYSKSGEDGWQKSEITQAEYESGFDSVFDEYLVIEAFKDKYSDFDYDEEQNAYNANDLTVDGATCAVSVTMKNGKIAAMTVSAVKNEETYEFAVTVTDYGTTEIDLPEIEE